MHDIPTRDTDRPIVLCSSLQYVPRIYSEHAFTEPLCFVEIPFSGSNEARMGFGMSDI
jgi:hypothetical protein